MATLLMKSIEEIALTLDKNILKMNKHELVILGVTIGLRKEETQDLTLRQIKKKITEKYEEIMDEENTPEDKKKESLINIIDDITVITSQKQKLNETEEDDCDEQDRLDPSWKLTPAVRSRLLLHDVDNNDDDSDVTTKSNHRNDRGCTHHQGTDATGKKSLYDWGVMDKTSLLRREFRVKGQIGEVGQKDKLSYISLMHQISEADQQGYDDDEIVSGVIRAMTPNLTLRNVLEASSNLTRKRLLSFLEAHYGEQNTADLWSKLSSLSQCPDESSYSFVLRCVELKQKILLSSQRASIKFEKPLLSQLLHQTLIRGLGSTYVVQEIKHLLNEGVSDEELIIAVTKASTVEQERTLLQSKTKNLVKVNQIQKGETHDEDQLASVVKALSQQVAILQKDINEMKNASIKVPYGKPKCKFCGYSNCRHCFKCGKEDHISRYCRGESTTRNQGNEQ